MRLWSLDYGHTFRLRVLFEDRVRSYSPALCSLAYNCLQFFTTEPDYIKVSAEGPDARAVVINVPFSRQSWLPTSTALRKVGEARDRAKQVASFYSVFSRSKKYSTEHGFTWYRYLQL